MLLKLAVAFAEWLWGVLFRRPSDVALGESLQKEKDRADAAEAGLDAVAVADKAAAGVTDDKLDELRDKWK